MNKAITEKKYYRVSEKFSFTDKDYIGLLDIPFGIWVTTHSFEVIISMKWEKAYKLCTQITGKIIDDSVKNCCIFVYLDGTNYDKDEYIEVTWDELMEAALCGVKYMNSVIEIEAVTHRVDNTYQTPFEAKQTAFKLIDALFGIIGRIKLKNLIKIFPIDKTYDGDKWGCKDYFFTMDVLREKGLDNAVGRDNVFDLMWDYMNSELRELTVFYMSCMSAMYKQQTGVGMAEKFCEDNGIGTYTMDRENGLLIDNQSGEIAKVSNKPSFMQIVK